MDASEFMVWQRVLEEPRQEALGAVLYRLAGKSRCAVRDYRALSERFRGMPREAERWERENLEAILGLFRLSVGRTMGRCDAEDRESQNHDGAFLYRRALEQLQEYTALSAQPHFGVVFSEMAGRQRRICDGLVRMLSVSSGQ